MVGFSPSGNGSNVMAVLLRLPPRLTRWGLSDCTFKALPVSVSSKEPSCTLKGNKKSREMLLKLIKLIDTRSAWKG